MVAIIKLIGYLIAGYFFFRYYKKIDNKLFSSIKKGYQSFGIELLYLSAIIGFVMAVVLFYDADNEIVIYVCCGAVSLVTAMSVFQVFLYLKSPKAIFYKSLFMVISCLFTWRAGMAAGVVLMCILLLSFIFSGFGALMGEGTTSTTNKWKWGTDEYGNKVQTRDNGNGDVDVVGGPSGLGHSQGRIVGGKVEYDD